MREPSHTELGRKKRALLGERGHAMHLLAATQPQGWPLLLRERQCQSPRSPSETFRREYLQGDPPRLLWSSNTSVPARCHCPRAGSLRTPVVGRQASTPSKQSEECCDN